MAADFLTSNINALKAHHPELFQRLWHFFQDTNRVAALTPLPDSPFTNVKGGPKDQALYAKSPEQHYKDSLTHSSLGQARQVILLGLGLGEVVNYFWPERPAELRDLLVVEPRLELFAEALKHGDWTAYLSDPAIQFCIGVDVGALFDFLKNYFLSRERLPFSARLRYLHFLPSLAWDGPYYLKVAEAVKAVLEQVKDAYEVSAEDNYFALFNILKNKAVLERQPSLFDLKGSWPAQQAVILGAGPALTPQLQLLTQHRGKFMIGCCDAALKTALNHGITPDFITCSERVILQKNLLGDLPEGFKAPLFTLPSLHPDIARSYPGPLVWVPRPATFGAWLWPDHKDFHVGLGVSSLTFTVAQWLGAKSFYLMGQNFSFARDTEAAYAAGSSDYLTNASAFAVDSLYAQIEGYDGLPRKTTKQWKLFAHEMDELGRRCDKPVANVILATEGAWLKHAPQLDPQEFWRSVPAMQDVARPEWSALLKQHSKGGLPLGKLIEITADELAILENLTAAALTGILDDFYNRLNQEYQQDKLGSAFTGHARAWEDQRQQLMARFPELFDYFVNCVFGPKRIRTLMARESLPRDEAQLVLYIYNYFFKTQEWFQHLLSDVTRLRGMLGSI